MYHREHAEQGPGPCVVAVALLMVLMGSAGCDPAQHLLVDDDFFPEFSPVAIEVELGEIIPTVISVRWTVDTDEASSGWIEYGATESYGDIWPGIADGPTGFKAVLIGFKPSTRVYFRAVAVVDGEELHSVGQSVVTGPLPSGLALPILTTLDPDAASGGYLVTSINSTPSSVVILDADGDVVWWYTPDETWNLLFVSRALLARDRSSMFYLSTPEVLEPGDHENQWIVEMSLDGSSIRALQVTEAHHDFLQLSDGNLAVLESDIRPVGNEQIKGDRIVEIDSDGKKTEIFSVWDHLAYEPNDEDLLPADEWTHVNALDVDEEEEAYYLSAHHLNSILKVDRGTGELLWQAGGGDSAFALAGGSTDLYQRQHQFQLVDGGILVFDNGEAETMTSRAVQYDLDEEAETAELVWEFAPDPALWIYCLGDVSRLSNGNTLITWATSGRLEEVTPEGETALQLDLPLGVGFGYTTWAASLVPIP